MEKETIDPKAVMTARAYHEYMEAEAAATYAANRLTGSARLTITVDGLKDVDVDSIAQWSGTNVHEGSAIDDYKYTFIKPQKNVTLKFTSL